MTDGLYQLINNTSVDNLDNFSNNTRSTLTAQKYVEKVSVDFSWVDEIYDTIPYIDNIIRNPRKFITQEEDVIRIEKVKKVTEESVKHLAQHTSLIQDIDQDGSIKPLKLLNVFREETIDLYENRFIYSLVNNLYVFIQNQLVYKDEESFNKEVKTVNYEAITKLNEEDVTLKLSLRSANLENLTIKGEKAKDIKKKIEYIADIIDDFMSSKFVKEMKNATPVRSPIRKTNVILKDVDFGYALKLWEFLENFNVETPLKKYNETINLKTLDLENDFLLTYFLNYSLLDDRSKIKTELSKNEGLRKLIFDAAKDFDINEKELEKVINDGLKEAKEYKEMQKKGINDSFKKFVEEHQMKAKTAAEILK